ncbi:MAG: IS110 family transposase [Spirochaetes bacterium]|nr:IS110 family transposase [Spirochaetota bacterium]
MNYIGIDLHSNRITADFRSPDNSSRKAAFSLHDPDDRNQFLSDLSPSDNVAFEASTNSFAFYDLLKERVKDVFVLNTIRFRLICDSGKKTDHVDAAKISGMLKYHVESRSDFLPVVYVPDTNIRTLRSLFSTYKHLNKQIVSTKNRIKSILTSNLYSYRGRNIFGKDREEIMGLNLSCEYRIQLEILYEELDMLEKKKQRIKEAILYYGREYEDQIDIITSVSGISAFIAIALISDYADISRFKTAKQFTSYLRSAPRVHASNETVHIGKTNKCGRKTSAPLLVQAITHFISLNPYIGRFYGSKRQGKGAGKVRMAVIRKILVAVYYMLKKKEYYRFRNTKNHILKMNMYRRFVKKYETALKTT